jgi:hypothetical protein
MRCYNGVCIGGGLPGGGGGPQARFYGADPDDCDPCYTSSAGNPCELGYGGHLPTPGCLEQVVMADDMNPVPPCPSFPEEPGTD